MAVALSSSALRTRIAVMRSHAGAASAPQRPMRNEVVSNEAGPANPADTAAANTTEIANATVCVTIRSRRGSTTSVSAPAGRVRRKSGSVVATWAAETSLGLGLRLVIIQAEPVSNIASPTLDSDVAMRMTMKAGLWMRPELGSPFVVESAFNSLVKSSARFPNASRPRDLRAPIAGLWQAQPPGALLTSGRVGSYSPALTRLRLSAY